MRDIGEISVHTLTACHVRRIYRLQRSGAGRGKDGHAPVIGKDVTQGVKPESFMDV